MTLLRPGPVESPPGRPQSAPQWWLAVGAVVVLALVHALAVAPHYHVGSFDDDANYILVARALAGGAGLTAKVAGFAPVVGVYPPGYGILLAPLAWLWPHALLPFRALSLVCFLALFPLTWVYLQRRSVARPAALVMLVVLGLNPVAATFATMVMPEMPFLVVLLILLLVLPKWEAQTRTLTAAGAATAVLMASLVWLKEAGLGLSLGVVCWLLLRRLWRKALVAGLGSAVLVVPFLIARAAVGTALIGSRYAREIGGPYRGGLVGRVFHLPPHGLSTYITFALPSSILPVFVSPAADKGTVSVVLAVIEWTAAPLMVIGYAVWLRRYRDPASVMIPAYLLETLLFPYINERRVLLVMPILVAWYVLGAWIVCDAIVRFARSSRRRSVGRAAMALPIALVAVMLAALIPQFSRDYLFNLGQNSSQPAGSPYMQLLHALGRPSDVVETSYLWTTALFSHHRTARGAFDTAACDAVQINSALRQDDAAFLLSAALNRPGLPDGGCIVPAIAAQPNLVRLYRSPQDQAAVYELIGAGTPRPHVQDLIPASRLSSAGPTTIQRPEEPLFSGEPAGTYPATETAAGTATLTWAWSQARLLTQISLGAAGGEAGSTSSVAVESLDPDGSWHPVLAAPGPVGAGQPTRYLLATFRRPVVATAVRVTIVARGQAQVHDLHVLGQSG